MRKAVVYLEVITIGDRTIRFCLMDSRSKVHIGKNFDVSGCQPLFLGRDVLHGLPEDNRNMGRIHSRLQSLGLATKLVFTDCRISGLARGEEVYFYTVQGLFRTVFLYHPQSMQRDCLHQLYAVWRKVTASSPARQQLQDHYSVLREDLLHSPWTHCSDLTPPAGMGAHVTMLNHRHEHRSGCLTHTSDVIKISLCTRDAAEEASGTEPHTVVSHVGADHAISVTLRREETNGGGGRSCSALPHCSQLKDASSQTNHGIIVMSSQLRDASSQTYHGICVMSPQLRDASSQTDHGICVMSPQLRDAKSQTDHGICVMSPQLCDAWCQTERSDDMNGCLQRWQDDVSRLRQLWESRADVTAMNHVGGDAKVMHGTVGNNSIAGELPGICDEESSSDAVRCEHSGNMTSGHSCGMSLDLSYRSATHDVQHSSLTSTDNAKHSKIVTSNESSRITTDDMSHQSQAVQPPARTHGLQLLMTEQVLHFLSLCLGSISSEEDVTLLTHVLSLIAIAAYSSLPSQSPRHFTHLASHSQQHSPGLTQYLPFPQYSPQHSSPQHSQSSVPSQTLHSHSQHSPAPTQVAAQSSLLPSPEPEPEPPSPLRQALLTSLGSWVGQEFHGMCPEIQDCAAAFKRRHITSIDQLPPAEDMVRQLFPPCMLALTRAWLGLGELGAGAGDAPAGDSCGVWEHDHDHCYSTSSSPKRRRCDAEEERGSMSDPSSVKQQSVQQLTLELLNNTLVSGMALLVYCKL